MRTATLLFLALALGCGPEPERGRCVVQAPIGSICGFEHPEDVEYVAAAGVLIASDIRLPKPHPPAGGFLAMLVPGQHLPRHVWPTGTDTDVAPDPTLGDPACPGPPDAEHFAPHGITSVADRVYAVVHAEGDGGREAVEVFRVRGQGAETTLAWGGCVPLPPNVWGNDTAVAPDGELIVANYAPSASAWHMLRGSALGSATGDVLGWTRTQGWRHIPNTAASLPNGVAVSADGQWLFYASTGGRQVVRVPLHGDGATTAAPIDGRPDNLSWTDGGKLLVGVHTAGRGFFTCAVGRTPCRSSWAIDEVDPAAMTVTRRFAHDGSVVGAVASAAEVRGTLYLGAVFDDRIGIIPATN